jgi:hypothetical protein
MSNLYPRATQYTANSGTSGNSWGGQVSSGGADWGAREDPWGSRAPVAAGAQQEWSDGYGRSYYNSYGADTGATDMTGVSFHDHACVLKRFTLAACPIFPGEISSLFFQNMENQRRHREHMGSTPVFCLGAAHIHHFYLSLTYTRARTEPLLTWQSWRGQDASSGMMAAGHTGMSGGMYPGPRTGALNNMAASAAHPMGSGMGMGMGMGHAGVGHTDYQQMMITQQARVSISPLYFRLFTCDASHLVLSFVRNTPWSSCKYAIFFFSAVRSAMFRGRSAFFFFHGSALTIHELRIKTDLFNHHFIMVMVPLVVLLCRDCLTKCTKKITMPKGFFVLCMPCVYTCMHDNQATHMHI